MSRSTVRAIVFDAGHTLLEMDYARLTAYLASCGHDLAEAGVRDAGGRARMRLDTERGAQASRERTGEGRYVRYLTEYLGITDDAERRAIAEWRRGFNAPIGLCHQADGDAPKALQRARGRAGRGSHLELQRLGEAGARDRRARPAPRRSEERRVGKEGRSEWWACH